MAVKIRLARFGKKNQPSYRIVAIDERLKRNGKYLENLGIYNPLVNPPMVKVNKERFDYWLSVGATPSMTVSKLLKVK